MSIICTILFLIPVSNRSIIQTGTPLNSGILFKSKLVYKTLPLLLNSRQVSTSLTRKEKLHPRHPIGVLSCCPIRISDMDQVAMASGQALFKVSDAAPIKRNKITYFCVVH